MSKFALPLLLLAMANPAAAITIAQQPPLGGGGFGGSQTSVDCGGKQGSLVIDCNESSVPVPYDRSFIGSIAGAATASEIILGVINVLLAIVGLLSVLFVIIGGIRYVTASGNEENAAAAKKTILHAVIGISIVILSFVIVRVISNALIKSRAPSWWPF